jgi:hypothetical protein
MAKMIHVCFRSPEKKNLTRTDFEGLSNRICPDNITPHPPLIRETDSGILAVFNPNPAVLAREDSVCLGNLISGRDEWWKPRTAVPDGSFVLTRVDSEYIESIADVAGTRALWYVHTDDVFMASTSMRAIVYCLRSFDLNREAVSWLISAGTIGPRMAWDKRIQFLGGHSKVLLNRATWELTVSRETLEVKPVSGSHNDHMLRICNAIQQSVKAVELDASRWMLLLSGGCDSRVVGANMKDRQGLRTITWGTKDSERDETGDARLAARLADAWGLPHIFMATDSENPESIEEMLHRYLAQGEGRLDRFEAYTDGFKIWKFLFESGVDGVIRGDRAWGGHVAYDEMEVRDGLILMTLEDYSNIPAAVVQGLARQTIPDYLKRRSTETLAAWRDRLNVEFGLSTNLSANAELKFGYVEIVNPLINRTMVATEWSMPDSYRTERVVYKAAVKSMSPDVPEATRLSIASHKNLVRSVPFVKLIREELQTPQAEALFGKEFVAWILPQIKPALASDGVVPPSLEDRIRRMMPDGLKHFIRRFLGHKVSKRNLEPNLIAFRAFMASRMIRLLQEDAAVILRHENSQS